MSRELLYEDEVAAHLLGVSVETIRRRARRLEGAVRQKRGRRVVWLVPVSYHGAQYVQRLQREE